MANILRCLLSYAVYCAAKLALFRKGLVICDIFKETDLYLKRRYLKESGCQKIYEFSLKFNLFGITEARNIHYYSINVWRPVSS